MDDQDATVWNPLDMSKFDFVLRIDNGGCSRVAKIKLSNNFDVG